MSFTDEDRIKGGENRATHGVHAISNRGEAAMTPEQRQTFGEIKASLDAPEGIIAALKERVAMGLLIVNVIEQYSKDQVNSGKTPDQIPILKAWPAFQNSTIRALKQLMDTMPNDRDRAGFAELVGEMTERVDKQASAGEQEQEQEQEQQEQEEAE